MSNTPPMPARNKFTERYYVEDVNVMDRLAPRGALRKPHITACDLETALLVCELLNGYEYATVLVQEAQAARERES